MTPGLPVSNPASLVSSRVQLCASPERGANRSWGRDGIGIRPGLRFGLPGGYDRRPPSTTQAGSGGILQAAGGSALRRPGEAHRGHGRLGFWWPARSRFPTPGPGNRGGPAPSVTCPAGERTGPGVDRAGVRSADGGGVVGEHRSPRPLGLQEVTEPLERPGPDLGDTTFGDAEESRDLDEGLALHERE